MAGKHQEASDDDQIPFEQLLKHNDLAIIENPLRRIPEDRLSGYIKSFHDQDNLANVVDVDTLIRGARLARDEEAFMAGEGADGYLSQVEAAALGKEKESSIWTESRELKIILLTCCVGSVVQGWAQGAIVGANQTWPKEFNLDLGKSFGSSGQEQGQSRDIWLFSATNAIVYFAASSVGAFLCDPFTEIFLGRRGAIFAAALFTATASIGEAFTDSWQGLFACRFLLGIGMGAKSSVIPVYESEVSPARLRGQILTSWQTGTALGIAISGAIALIEPDSWRFQISSSFIPAVALLLLVFVGSESPRWLIKKQRYGKAYSNLLRLRENHLLAARDLIFIWAQLQVETTLFMRTDEDVIDFENRVPYLDQTVYLREISLPGYARRISQLFTIPRARRATVASALVMLAQQMTGINVFAFLASTLFEYGQERGIPHKGSLWLYFGFGIANFFSSLIAYFYIDSKGRRWLLMLSLAAMFPFLLVTAFSFTAHNPPKQGLVATFLAYSPGAGVVPFLYSSEIFPQVLRGMPFVALVHALVHGVPAANADFAPEEVGMAWASGVCWMGAGILDLCVPTLIHALSQTGLLCLFAQQGGQDAAKSGLSGPLLLPLTFARPQSSQNRLHCRSGFDSRISYFTYQHIHIMRLLHSTTKVFGEFFDSDIPKYATLSHRWGSDEATFQDFENGKPSDRKGYAKIDACCTQALQNELEWIWVDTCCIDKKSSAELTEAINSMYSWYKNAEVCCVFLTDVWSDGYGSRGKLEMESFRESSWFTRGWTLQELLAPSNVHFFDQTWQYIGSKSELAAEISVIIGIDGHWLCGPSDNYDKMLEGPCTKARDCHAHLARDPWRTPHEQPSVAIRMSWVSKRQTSRLEDMAYCLLGLFDVEMPLLYGEGRKAFQRLQHEIMRRTDDDSIFAWAHTTSSNYSGVLADWPDCFADSRYVNKCERFFRPPYSMTNRGLHFPITWRSFDVPNTTSNRHSSVLEIPLNCATCGPEGFKNLVIRLDNLGGEVWYRVGLSKLLQMEDKLYQDPLSPLSQREQERLTREDLLALEHPYSKFTDIMLIARTRSNPRLS
ncbi:MAG: hypothetical protein Q9216_004307 [Gyalolechia sp. 2 TL-2023]